jgi:hypothetical protein
LLVGCLTYELGGSFLSRLVILDRCSDEGFEERMGACGSGLELGMKLTPQHERVIL